MAPFAPIYTLNVVNFADPFGSAGIANPFPADFGPKIPPSNTTFALPTTVGYFFPLGFHLPEITIWNLTLERQIRKTWLISVAYTGNKAIHLYGTSDQEPMADINAARVCARQFDRSEYAAASALSQLRSHGQHRFRVRL